MSIDQLNHDIYVSEKEKEIKRLQKYNIIIK